MFNKIKHFNSFLFLIFIFLTSFNPLRAQESSIIGTWVSEEDPNFKMVFEGNICTWLYASEPSGIFNFSLSNSTPQCGQEVLVDTETKYLHLIKTTNSTDEICYEIYGLTQQYLTLRVIDKSGFLIFIRQ